MSSEAIGVGIEKWSVSETEMGDVKQRIRMCKDEMFHHVSPT
jgi:hypothetical protein